MSNTHPTISLCMIVKDEAEYLPTCLESVRNFVNEIVIVDTGSTDNTVAIARKFGARVFHFEWCNDFAAARNESLARATGEWILYLDADERLDAQNKSKITTLLIEHPKAMAMNVRVVIPQPENNLIAGFSLDYCRLFRNMPEIRFEGPVHEQIIPSILRLGGEILKTSVVIDHWGFGMRQRRRDNRIERNVRLLEEEVDKHADDAFLHYHLATTYRTIGKVDPAIHHFEVVMRLNDLKPELMANTAMFLGQLYLENEDLLQSGNYCRQALNIRPQESFPHYILATIALMQDDIAAAIEHLKTILRQRKEPADEMSNAEIDVAQVYLDLGNCYFLNDEPQEACLQYEKAVLHNPRLLQANYHLGKCYLKLNRPKSASKWFERVLELNPGFEPARQELELCYEHVI